MSLVDRVHEKIAAQREKDAAPNPSFTGDQEAVAALVAWCQGIEDALTEIALEVEKLTSAAQGESPINDK